MRCMKLRQYVPSTERLVHFRGPVFFALEKTHVILCVRWSVILVWFCVFFVLVFVFPFRKNRCVDWPSAYNIIMFVACGSPGIEVIVPTAGQCFLPCACILLLSLLRWNCWQTAKESAVSADMWNDSVNATAPSGYDQNCSKCAAG